MAKNEEMVSAQDCALIMKKYLSSEDFKVLAYNTHHNDVTDTYALNIKAAIEGTHQEVSFLAMRFLSYPLFQWKENLPKVSPHDLICGSIDLASTYITKDNILVVLVDQSKPFNLAEVCVAMSVKHVKLALEAFAKYHAASISFEEAKSTELQKSFTLIEEHPVLQKGNALLGGWLNTRLQSLNALIDLLPQNELKLNQQFKEGLKKIAINAIDSINATKIFRGVLCRGYAAGNSVLFENNNGTPVACKLMNFELACYAPPALDVLQFIYSVTNIEIRKHHLHELLHFYYENLQTELKSRALNAEHILPTEEEFEISVHHLLPLIKFQTTCFKQIQYLNKDVLQKMKPDISLDDNATSLIVSAFKTNENYRRLITESLLDLRDVIINPELTKEDCFQIVKNKIGTTSYDLLSYELLPIGNVNGFFGDHKKLKIQICVDNQPQTLELFVKFTPKGKAQKSIADDCGSFYKEIFFYRRFVPMIQGFDVPVINDCTVPCYFTRQDDVMVFEDFAIRKYGILNHRQPLTYEQVSVIVKQLAKFHASSIILEEKLSETTKTKYCLKEHYDKELQESFFNHLPNHQGAKSVEISFDAIDHQISLFPELEVPLSDEDFKIKIKKACQSVYNLVKTSSQFRNAVCHGDLWVSNILVQKTDEKLIDCRFVDFQIMRYCPPAHDLLGFIHLTTTRNFRKQYMDEVVKLYHDELSHVLKNHGYDIEDIYPFNHFIKSIEYMLPQAICQTVMYYHICIGDPELMKNHMASEEMIKQIFLEDRRAFIEEMCEKDPIYRERSKESIEDLRDLCVKYF